MPLRSPESAFCWFYLNLSLGLAFVYGCHGGDVQVTVAVYPVNVGAHVYYAGCDGGSDVLPATIPSVLMARWIVGDGKYNTDGRTN